ncbi:hypothetical protein JTB14_009349 [Gonioctena quinquepunctata]|nr:hypothetical protein JTB14_009349 [Gonioctena quinquepunctata]
MWKQKPASSVDDPVGDNCTITERSQAPSVLQRCDNIIVRNVSCEAGRTFELAMRRGSTLHFEGEFTFAWKEWEGPVIKIIGDFLRIRGAAHHKLDGRGMGYWNAKGGPSKIRPTFLYIQTANSSIENINMVDCPERCVDVNSMSLTLRNWVIDVSAGNPSSKGTILGENTIGFNMTNSSKLVLDNLTIKNQAECVLVDGGINMTVTNLSCYGGSGIHIVAGRNMSSLTRNIVRDIVFEDCNVINSTYGIHVSSVVDGGAGRMSNITFSNIQFSGIKNYGIKVEQNYWINGNISGEPNNNVPISGLMMRGINGTMKGHDSVPVHILCARGGCFNFFWSDIHIRANSQPNSCNYIPTGYHC